MSSHFYGLQSRSFSPSPARLSIRSSPAAAPDNLKSASAAPTSQLRRGQQSPLRLSALVGTSDSDSAAAAARRRADEAAVLERRASSSYAAVRLPRAAPRPGTAVGAATAAAAMEADVLVLFGRRWLPVNEHSELASADPRAVHRHRLSGTADPMIHRVSS